MNASANASVIIDLPKDEMLIKIAKKRYFYVPKEVLDEHKKPKKHVQQIYTKSMISMIKADDGDGHTDETTVEISTVAPTPTPTPTPTATPTATPAATPMATPAPTPTPPAPGFEGVFAHFLEKRKTVLKSGNIF